MPKRKERTTFVLMRLRSSPTFFAAARQPYWQFSRDSRVRRPSTLPLRIIGVLLGITLSFPALLQSAPPNVVIIMPDDLSWNDFSYFNPAGAQTPAIDALARTSVRLTDFHVSPTCSPTRASLLTGRYSNATGVWHTILGRYFLRTDEMTLADVLKPAGYRSAVFGKWHLGDSYPFRPRDRGFDHSIVFRGGGADQQHNLWGNRNLPPAVAFVDDLPRAIPEKSSAGIPTYATTYFTSQAIAFMEEQVALQQPFFAYLAYNVAHLPHDRPPASRPGISDQQAVVEHLDQQVGRVLAFLKSAAIEESTIVIFLTDNGSASAHFRAGKASPFEGGHRVPCFIRWPAGGVGGSVSSAREMPYLS
ncbi:MAG TPA: sulfatase-like hydrolase/transferase, partial [Opitutaceae bacterium]|nr:sulfatase-like hydrolase/transferase [Opitutaceae bacterium]